MARQDRDPNINDVAELAGVSPTTVSRVLNNRGYLSEATKQKVADAMKELHYRPNEVARALFGQRTRMIGVIVPAVSNPFFGELTVGLEHSLSMKGYRTLLCNSLGYAENERNYVQLLESSRVDGLITSSHNDHLDAYLDTRLPVVAIDRDLGEGIVNVRADNYGGARQATDLLLSRGSTAPALFTSTRGLHNLREAGYLAAVEAAGLEPIVRSVQFGLPEKERARRIVEELELLDGHIDAVFATDDVGASAAVEWARGRGKSVPEEFRVIGFDGTPAVRALAPWLSTVQQPIKKIAHTAVDKLVEMIEDPEKESAGGDGADSPNLVELPVKVIDAETT